jgi:hypothetical protein
VSEAEFFLTVFALIGGTVLAWPLVRALAERIRPGGDGPAKEELRALREDVLGELQQVRREIAELSERVDFTERLLAKQGQAGRLPGS